ncbi:MAG: 7-cyano-7-deazaguanine synthase QueC [Pseudomonadota bacterium]|nr:7-cyano-7-deazaguanine synthase QueC [Pseudomonadota bacterium]
MTQKKAVVLLSGGLDSATCLAIARAEGYECYALSFDYGQRSQAELNAAKALADRYAKKHSIIQIGLSDIGGSALTDNSIDVPVDGVGEDVPVTYVPARNTVFLSLALGWAEVLEADAIFIGVNAVDYSGYPDCRPEFIAAFERVMQLATKRTVEGQSIKLETPLIDLTKAQIISKAAELDMDLGLTVSCYQADEKGRACGACDSCRLRSLGFEQAGQLDPTHYQK